MKFALGLFDDPYRYSDAAREKQALGDARAPRRGARRGAQVDRPAQERRRTAAARQGRRRRSRSIGPLADDKDSPLGNWRAPGCRELGRVAARGHQGRGAAVDPGRPRRGREARHRPAQLHGAARRSTRPTARASRRRSRPRRAPTSSCVAIGEDAFQSGEGRSQADIGLKGLQEELLKAVFDGEPEGRGRADERAPADARAGPARTCPPSSRRGSSARRPGHAIADVLFGDYNPSGKLPVAFPRSVGQLPIDLRAQEHRPARARARRHVVAPTPTCRTTRCTRSASASATRRFTYSEPKVSAAGDRPRRLGAGHGHRHEHRQARRASRSRSSTCATWSAA